MVKGTKSKKVKQESRQMRVNIYGWVSRCFVLLLKFRIITSHFKN